MDALKKLTKEDVLQFYNCYINPKSSTRRSVSVHMNSVIDSASAEDDSAPTVEKGVKTLEVPNITEFRKQLAVAEPAEPIQTLEKYLEPKHML